MSQIIPSNYKRLVAEIVRLFDQARKNQVGEPDTVQRGSVKFKPGASARSSCGLE